jgi:hypothetical protein
MHARNRAQNQHRRQNFGPFFHLCSPNRNQKFSATIRLRAEQKVSPGPAYKAAPEGSVKVGEFILPANMHRAGV